MLQQNLLRHMAKPADCKSLPDDPYALLIVELPTLMPALDKGIIVTLCDKGTTVHSAKYRWNPEATVYNLQSVMHSDPLHVNCNSLWGPSVPGQDKGDLSLVRIRGIFPCKPERH